MNVMAIIQARLGSQRLPRKALMDIAGKPMIQHVVERVRELSEVDQVVVATPSAADADALAPYVLDAAVFHASSIAEGDVLGRYAACVRHFGGADIVMRITGDCPLWNPDEGRRVLMEYLRLRPTCDYLTNVYPGYYRDGEDVEVFSAEALFAAEDGATAPHDREHVTPFIYRTFASWVTQSPADGRSAIKTSVDTLEDLERVRAIMGHG
jgi:spore coat polysaccharide biosynthesis protein SpsF (cytidylyltransferase family)